MHISAWKQDILVQKDVLFHPPSYILYHFS